MRNFCPRLLFVLFFVFSAPAHATCINPVGDHGDMLYNRDHTVMQYCNGTNWISMDASRAGGGADNLGNHTATKDLDMASFKVKNAAIPTASADLTNKAYVDAAVASAAGSGGGNTGTTCMYFSTSNNSACPAGWSQAGADQSYFPVTGLPHRVCCMGGGSLLDEMPSAFDFPRSPPIAGTAGHTWSPLEITGFDSTNVTIASSPDSGLAEFRICADSACSNVLKNWRSTPAGIASGNYLQIRIGAHSTTRSLNPKITITVGGMTDEAPITPDFFLAFVTAATFNANLGGISGADAKCQSAAEAAGHPGTFRAYIASDTTNLTLSRFENKGTTQAFYTTNLGKVADNWTDLTNASLDLPLNYTESGNTVPGTENTWTGLYNSGTASSSAASCTAWSATTGSGYFGLATSTNYSWASYSSAACGTGYHLYCFQTVLPN